MGRVRRKHSVLQHLPFLAPLPPPTPPTVCVTVNGLLPVSASDAAVDPLHRPAMLVDPVLQHVQHDLELCG